MTAKTLIRGVMLGALAMALGGCVYGPVPAYAPAPDSYYAYPSGGYYAYPSGGYYASPPISFRFFYGSGWHGQHWGGGRWRHR